MDPARENAARRKSRLMFGAALLVPVLPISTVADVAPRAMLPSADLILATSRPSTTLADFMRRTGFVEPNLLPEIVQASAAASIPPSMIVCIEFVESSGGKHVNEGTNNPLGWNNGKTAFPSVRAAIRHVSQQLGSGRWYAGKTLEEKLRVYNPRPAYAEKVLGCMRQFPE